MTVIFVVLPLAVIVSTAAVLAFLWSTKSGQLDDLDTPPLRMLRDETTRRDAPR
jgi:cbb3-type cytochrome oxidase maturation protein